MGLARSSRTLTEDEYLALERQAEVRSEFLDGEMFAMAGGTLDHSLIAANLGAELRAHLRDRPCRVFNADLRIKVEATGLHTYPDLSVACGAAQLGSEARDVLLNPILLAEVLSPSSEAYDRGRKFEHYRLIPSLRDFLLVHQHQPRIECFSRQPDATWVLREAVGLTASLPIPSMDIEIRLAEVFARVEFAPTPLHPPPALLPSPPAF